MNREELNGIGKDGIVSEGIFVRFPELVPVCREHYWREDGKHKKLLMVAERLPKATILMMPMCLTAIFVMRNVGIRLLMLS